MSLLTTRTPPKCLICTDKVAVHKEYNIKCHYLSKHVQKYEKYQRYEKTSQVANFKTCLLRQQNFFKKGSKESWAAVEAKLVR